MTKYNSGFLLLAVFVCLLSTCDNTLDPFDEERGLYSVFGFLALYSDVNYIRIKDLDTPLIGDSTRHIDATVTLENLETGATEVLEDTIVMFNDVYTHNFRSTMDIVQKTRYRLRVERSDGKTLSATALTPVISNVSLAPDTIYCRSLVTFTLEPIIEGSLILIWGGFDYNGKRFWKRIKDNSVGNDNGTYFVRLFRPGSLLPGDVNCDDLDTDNFYIKYTHYGPNFFGDVSQSLQITGGAGQFGGLYRDTLSFKIEPYDS